MEKQSNKRIKYNMVGIAILASFLIVVFFIWKKYQDFSDSKQVYKNQVKCCENLYFKPIDPDKVAHIPNKSLEYVEDELILDTMPDMAYEKVEKILTKKYDTKIVGYIEVTNTYQIEVQDDIAYDDLLNLKEELEKEDFIVGVFLNKIYPVNSLEGYYPNDPQWKDEWSDIAGGENWALEFMKVPEAWHYMRDIALHTPEEVKINVFEAKGMDYKHEDLKDYFIELPLCNAGEQNHGTAVSGIIGAGFDNGIGITGVVPDVKLQGASFNGMSERINKTTDVNVKTANMVIRVALVYLITNNNDEQKTSIINASWGFETLVFAANRENEEAQEALSELNEQLELFLHALLDRGYDFLICKAAGNDNASVGSDKIRYYVRADEDDENATCGYISISDENSKKYKKLDDYKSRLDFGNVDAKYDVFSGINNSEIRDRIIVVGSIGITQDNGFFASDYSCSGARVDILAPGENIYVLESGNKYSTDSGWGTSYSAPYVSGVAGLMLSVNPKLSGKELKELLIKSSTGNYVSMLKEQGYEYKSVNADSAVRFADTYAHDSVYTWSLEPAIEADNIYYLNSNDALAVPVNMLNKQMENDYGYAVIKKDGTYGLIDMNGNLLDGMNFQKVDTHISRYHVTYKEPHYDSMTGTETTEFDLTEDGLSFAFGHGDVTFLYGGAYFWNDGLRQYYFVNEMPDPEDPIPVCKSSEMFNVNNSNFREYNFIEWYKSLSQKYAIYAEEKLVTDFIYDECGSYSEGLMAVCKDDKWGYVNSQGQIVIPLEYDASWQEYIPYEKHESLEMKDYCYAASDGYVVLCKDNKWELRDIEGEEVIPQDVFEEIRPVHKGKCWVKKNGKWGVIQIKQDTEAILKNFFYTWLDQWKYEDKEILVDSWRNNKSDFSECQAYIDPYSELFLSFKTDSDFGGRLSNSVALNIQELDIDFLGNDKYIVTVKAYMTQNAVDQTMYEQMVQNGYKTFQYEVIVNEDGLISELSKLD